jgi:lysophospholipase L1-like esterase
MTRGRLRLPGTGMLAVGVTLMLAVAGSAAYQVGGRRPAAAVPAPPPVPVAVTLGASITPAVVTYGGSATVSGTLADPAGLPVAGRVVEVVVARDDAPGTPVVVATPATDAGGRVWVTFRPAAGSMVWLRFAGEPGGAAEPAGAAAPRAPPSTTPPMTPPMTPPTTPAATPPVTPAPAASVAATRAAGAALPRAPGSPSAARSPSPAPAAVAAPAVRPWLAPAASELLRLPVAPYVRLTAHTRAGHGGWVTTLRGTVRPGAAGDVVRVEQRVHGTWRRIGTARLAHGGGFAYVVRHAAPGTYAYRVVRPAGPPLVTGSGRYDLRLARARAPALPGLPKGTGGPGQLLVTGDSLAYYLGRQLATARGARPTAVDSRPSSGLARADYFDWTAYARKQVAAGRPGSVVVFVGANDCQPLRTGGTGAWTAVGTPGWAAEYRRRAGALMRVYADASLAVGAPARPVYWIGLPIPRKPDIDACYRRLNAATAAAARDVGGVTWIDSWSVYAVAGHYSDRVDGILARQDDGIHITFAGTRLLTRKVYALLRP